MAVLTDFRRVAAAAIKMLEQDPELTDRLLGHARDAEAYARLGFKSGAAPPRLAIGTAWDEILLLLAGTGQQEAYQALHISVWEAYDGCEEIRLYAPATVKKGRAALDALEIDRLRRAALARKLRTYDGEPVERLLDDTLAQLARLREFWRAAALAGEAIIACTG